MAAKVGSMSRMTKYLKPYELKLHFSNKYVSSTVVHKPTCHTVAAATSQEKDLREQLPATGDVAAAARIAEILASRLKVKDIPAVTFGLKKGERYHGKIKAFVDSLRENGIQLI
jgi:ribosomal protein L18